MLTLVGLAGGTALATPSGTANLHVVFGGHNVPHPAKVDKGGEDAFFFDEKLGVFGIADGVGGSARNGIDPGLFSREVLQRCYQSVLHMGGGNEVPKVTDALQLASMAPLDLGGSTTLVLGQLDGSMLRLVNLGDSGAMLLRPAIRKFGENQEHSVLFPRLVLRSQDQSHYWNCPYQANARNFATASDNLDELVSPVKEGDVLIAATDGVLDNLFDRDLQACVSEHLTEMTGTDPGAAQEAMRTLAKAIAEKAAEMGLRRKDPDVSTPFMAAAAEEGYDFKGGKLDDVAIVCGVVRSGLRPDPRLVHNFDGSVHEEKVHDEEATRNTDPPVAAARGMVVPSQLQPSQGMPMQQQQMPMQQQRMPLQQQQMPMQQQQMPMQQQQMPMQQQQMPMQQQRMPMQQQQMTMQRPPMQQEQMPMYGQPPPQGQPQMQAPAQAQSRGQASTEGRRQRTVDAWWPHVSDASDAWWR